MTVMTHRGLRARVEVSEEDGCLVGHILDIPGIVGFHGATVDEVRAAFEDAAEDWLGWEAGESGSAVTPSIFQLILSEAGRYRWRLIASDGAVLAAASEDYETEAAALEAIERLRFLAALGAVERVA